MATILRATFKSVQPANRIHRQKKSPFSLAVQPRASTMCERSHIVDAIYFLSNVCSICTEKKALSAGCVSWPMACQVADWAIRQSVVWGGWSRQVSEQSLHHYKVDKVETSLWSDRCIFTRIFYHCQNEGPRLIHYQLKVWKLLRNLCNSSGLNHAWKGWVRGYSSKGIAIQEHAWKLAILHLFQWMNLSPKKIENKGPKVFGKCQLNNAIKSFPGFFAAITSLKGYFLGEGIAAAT